MLRDSVEIAAYEKIPRRGSGTLAASATNTLYISAIAVSTNGMVTLMAAWSENDFTL